MKYENWSLGYFLAKPYIVFAHWLTHRKIVVAGKNKIPRGKPLIFAPNHQNALSDDIAIVTCLPQQPVWLGRASLFDVKFTRPILRFLKIMPIYRIRDGRDSLGRNDEIFSKSITVLENNHTIAIYPEAAHSWKRQMLPHKKGIPRIVFLAEEKHDFNLDIKIVPIGIYFSHYWHIGSNLLVNVGDPISVLDYKEIYEENPARATLKLRGDIYEAIRNLTIEIRSDTFYEEFEMIREIFGKTFLGRSGKKETFLHRFRSDQQMVEKLESLEKNEPGKIKKIAEMAAGHMKQLKVLGIRDWLVDAGQIKWHKLAWNILALLLTLPLFIYGFLFNILPFVFLDRITRKKVKNISFRSTFFFAGGILLFPVVYVAELLLVSHWLPGFWLKLLFLISLPLSGKAAYIWYIGLLKTIGRCRLIRLRLRNKPDFQKLFRTREDIIEEMNSLC